MARSTRYRSNTLCYDRLCRAAAASAASAAASGWLPERLYLLANIRHVRAERRHEGAGHTTSWGWVPERVQQLAHERLLH